MKDFITYCHLTKFRTWLVEAGHVDIEGKGHMPLTHIPVSYYKDGNKNATFSLVRCSEKEDFEFINEAVKSGAMELIGEVEKSEYKFYTEEWKDKYEKLRKVGKYRESVVKRDDNDRVVLDKDGNTIKEPTTHTYVQGLFA